MYELTRISQDVATRFVDLRNVETNRVETCFDDSALISEKNFDFMKIGQLYECKIKLFGSPAEERNGGDHIVCAVVNKEVMVGQMPMVEVLVGEDRYYIVKQKVEQYLTHRCFYFYVTRKDLIQVDTVIYPDFL